MPEPVTPETVGEVADDEAIELTAKDQNGDSDEGDAKRDRGRLPPQN
jgi:hypothetical protein